ncbi:MAG: class I tRNA ligase family protein [Candidatus Nanosynbacter sp.]|nr:class I tRNA ligase family protein [Candidatus Nanosynbacter sp.]
MKFKHGTRRRAAEYEKDWVQRWKDDQTFERSVAQRLADNAYVFYDGPPFITGVPHHGTLLSSIVKDAVPRYWTMKGKRVERRWGWDCHGLPAENFVEKQMNIMDRRQIVTSSDQPAPLDKDGNPLPTISLEKYITKARESMVANSETWQGVIDRIGRWVDFKGAYRTMDKNFMESVWWAFKQLYEAGKIYEGEKVLMYDTKFATPVSKAEVTMDNDAYQTVTDPSVYVKFKLKDSKTSHKIVLNEHSKVLFVCNANVVRSQMAQAFYNHFTKTQNADSAGVNAEKYPTAKIPTVADFDAHLVAKNLDPLAVIDLMREKGIEVGASQRTQLTKDMLRNYDLVVNIANRNQTPDWLKGDNVVWWKIEDPHAESRKLAELACDEIEKRVKKLISGEVVDDIEGDDVNVLAWTTTPWTLPANLMLAVNPEMTYCEVLVDGEKLIIAEEALERTLQDDKHQPLEYDVLRKFPGSELVGKKYQPLDTGSTWPENDKIHTIYAADFVSHESGTGIVHIAPAYGEDDFELGKANGIAPFHVIDDNGYYTDTNYKGLEVWENNKFIAKDLKEKGVVWKIEYIRHEYPFNPRSKQRIMYRAIPSWFFDIQGQKPLMLEQNEHINWFPAHLKHGRFAKNIEQAPDWNLSRDRFWATAMPVWKGDRGTVKVVGSYAELKELSGVELDDYHRPWVDDITFEIDGETFTRIDKVLDCWFESGSMPFAQLHYPFENQVKFEQNYPADFIVEYIGQVRAWFYYVHAVNTALAEIGAFGEAGAQHKNAYSNVITTGVVAGNDGRKMSKSLGNFTNPNELMDKFSADSLRFLLLSSPLLNGEDFALHDKDVGDVARKLSMIWNMYDFFTMYAEVDGWEFDGEMKDPLSELTNPLDIWIVSRLHQLVAEVERHMDTYNIPDALSPILPFLDDASNWYVRRSRRRFWKSEDDGDKNDAYRTLHYVLVRLSYILAPFTPFLAEELYHNLTGDNESIHLKDWLPAGEVNKAMLRDMNALRAAVNDGLSKRAAEGVKVRQPLASAKLVSTISQNTPEEVAQFLVDIARDELNVKSVEAVTGSELDVPEASAQPSVVYDLTITPELKREGLMREVIRHVQSARKKAGLQVDDRIELGITSSDTEIAQAVDVFADTIKAETLAVKLGSAADDMEKYDVKVDGKPVEIYLKKAD